MSRSRGMGLIYVLMVLSLLSVMLVALVTTVREQLYRTRQYANGAAARYAAEAGVALALAALEARSEWRDGFYKQPLSSGRGTFTLSFDARGQSVNNLLSDDWAPSYRGSRTVPPRSALLVVQGEVDGVTRKVEVMVGPGGGDNVDSAAMVSGHVRMKGDVSMVGWRTLAGNEAMRGGLHSNLISDEADIVRYEGGGSISVYGEVTSAGTNERAVNFPTGVKTRNNAPVKALPYVDIMASIEVKAGRPPLPEFSKYDGGINYLPKGEYYINGDLEVDTGHLRLDDTKLYVKGNLKINGTIMGRGAVFVGGKTTLQGSTSVVTTDENYVALFSRGRVHLQGFDYVKYYDEAAYRNGDFAQQWWGGSRDYWKSREEYDDSTGSAGFVGLVYTNGSVYAEQQVGIVGAVIVRDDGSQKPEMVDDRAMIPGDLYLDNGATLIYVDEFFQNGKIFRDLHGLGVVSWIER